MKRQFAGTAVVILSVLRVLVLTTFVAPPRVGTAVMLPTPIPPDVGSCGIAIGARFDVRDCADPHTAEVVSTWRPGDPELELPAFGGARLRHSNTWDRHLRTMPQRTRTTPHGGEVVATQRVPLTDAGVFYTSDGGSDWLICVVESAGKDRLLDSVAGIGAGPLPWE